MKLLHTSDWHLGRMLYTKKDRQDEHACFLKWLLQTIQDNGVDLLLVAGDIFDNASPGSASQKMYYDFLLDVRKAGCRNMIVVGGNHDSPSFLNAPKAVLSALNITVIGNAGDNPADEVIVVRDADEKPMAIVCAAPFLRERDLSRFTEGETYSDRSRRIAESIKKHYEQLAEIAREIQKNTDATIPVIATGHLSVAGGKTVEDDGVRETYIGNIECVGSDIFPEIFDYVALGHYHIPSVISEKIRYCGSPLPMGFGEAAQRKCVYMVDFQKDNTTVSSLEIPAFQQLESIRGDRAFISGRLHALKASGASVWVEIIYEGSSVFPDFTSWAAEQTADTNIEILKLQNRQYLTEVLTQDDSTQPLEDLERLAVFDKLLDKNKVPDEQKSTFRALYDEITDSLIIES